MWRFSRTSLERLHTAHPALIEIFTESLRVSPVDFGISCGHRGIREQEVAFLAGRSRIQFPYSKHNRLPAEAVDFFPWVAGRGIVWDDSRLFFLIAGIVLGVGHARGHRLRWGGAWDGVLNPLEGFHDLPHVEILL